MSNAAPVSTPDGPDGVSRQGPIIGLFVVMLLLASTTVALRFYTRWRLLRTFGIDDWFIGLALVNFTRLSSAATRSKCLTCS